MNESYILYIDDERSAIKLLKEVFRLSGYKLEGVTSGREGLTLMRERPPDLLLLDLGMVDMPGVDVYRAMKQDPTLTAIPVIVISGKVPQTGCHLAPDLLPVEDYITKPFKIDRLTRSVERVLSTHKTPLD